MVVIGMELERFRDRSLMMSIIWRIEEVEKVYASLKLQNFEIDEKSYLRF